MIITDDYSQRLQTVTYPTTFNIKQENHGHSPGDVPTRQWVQLDKKQVTDLIPDMVNWLRGLK